MLCHTKMKAPAGPPPLPRIDCLIQNTQHHPNHHHHPPTPTPNPVVNTPHNNPAMGREREEKKKKLTVKKHTNKQNKEANKIN